MMFSTNYFKHQYHCRMIRKGAGFTLPPTDFSFLLESFNNFATDEYSTVDDEGLSVPPLACGFAKNPQHQHILSVVDEDGYLVLYNTHYTGNRAIIKTWQIHSNAVFDLQWLTTENKLLSGSGDQTIALHDIETQQKLETFRGHASSVKSISCQVGSDDVFSSGSRDGHIMTWDKRIAHKDGAIHPVKVIKKAHTLQPSTDSKARKRRTVSATVMDGQQSVTCVLYQNYNYLISAGAVDGCVKVWDLRKTYHGKSSLPVPVHVFPYPGTNSRRHGYSSLVKDSYGLRLFASCTDDVIYEFDIHNYMYSSKPVQTWTGHRSSSFYVKSAISPDNQFLLSGSSDHNAYIWQINNPTASPIVLSSHTAEVTSVAWSPNDLTKLVTLSDDTRIKFWRIYCREQDEAKLPPSNGHAIKISKETGTSTRDHCQSPQMFGSCPSTPSTMRSAPSTPPVTSPSTSSSTTIVKSRSLLEWLKSRSQDNTYSVQGASPPNRAERTSYPNTHEDAVTPTKRPPSHSGVGWSGASPHPSSQLHMKSPRCVLVSPAKSPARCRLKHAEENMITQKRANFAEEREESSPKRACLRNITSNSQFEAAVEGSRSVRQNLFKNNDNDSCSTLPHGLNDSSDTVTKLNLISERLSKDVSKNSMSMSPLNAECEKSACDKNESSSIIQSQDLMASLSSSDSSALIRSLSSCPVPPVTLSSTTSQPSTSSLKNSTVFTPLKQNHKEDMIDDETSLKQNQNDDLEDHDSPTRNLPNLVMDGIGNRLVTPPRYKSRAVTPKQNWLTKLRLEKLHKMGVGENSSPDDKVKSPGTKSPKSVKGMATIQTYFRMDRKEAKN